MPRDATLAALKIKPQTLYAYASRGRIGVRPDPADPRRSLYRADDVATLELRAARGRRTSDIAAGALRWGEPAIATSLSTVRHGVLVYRGVDAIEWARSATLEATAELLWRSGEAAQFRAPDVHAANPFEALATLVNASFPALGRSADRLSADAGTAIGHIAASLGVADGGEPIHRRLGTAWSLGPEDVERVRRALVLIADHELNASAFAARVAASTGASVAAGLLAGLCALSGPRHGGAGRALAALMDEAEKGDAASAVAGWLARGHALPGFGHPLYPDGDPRATAILDGLALDETAVALSQAAYEATGARPNVDFALASFARASRLPPDAAFSLFLLGRSVGWAAHIFEQIASATLIRPRARYDWGNSAEPDDNARSALNGRAEFGPS